MWCLISGTFLIFNIKDKCYIQGTDIVVVFVSQVEVLK